MTPQQLNILNALVTFAAEHIPGGLSDDEREVAKIVGQMALNPPQAHVLLQGYHASVCYCPLGRNHI